MPTSTARSRARVIAVYYTGALNSRQWPVVTGAITAGYSAPLALCAVMA